jgi:TetR/AcrR family transcriptional repressor of nem operon
MVDRGASTRERILAAAEPLVLQQGFAGTSLEDILSAARLTKGAFFHHFKGKSDLARALVERYAGNDYELFRRFAEQANAVSDDPLDALLIFVRLFEDSMQGLAEPPAGCVFAAYTHESLQFDPSIHDFVAESLRRWSKLYEDKFEAVLARYRPRRPVSARELAEMIVAIIEGGFILSRSYRDAALVARQSRQFRQYVELLFEDRKREPDRKEARGRRGRNAAKASAREKNR